MPVYKFIATEYGAHLLWHIVESEEALLKETPLTNSEQAAYQKITHVQRKKEWLASRMALKVLFAALGCQYTGLYKDVWGKPYIIDSSLHISISHCIEFAFVAVDREKAIGIDIQRPDAKLEKVKERVLNKEEIENAGNDLEKLCIYWCAKEALYKAYGGKGLSLKQDVSIKGFMKSNQGILQGSVQGKCFNLCYSFCKNHILTWCREA